LSTNGSVISSILSAFNGTSGLSSLIGELTSESTPSASLLSALSSLL
jgi:Ca2+/H+ antiporter